MKQVSECCGAPVHVEGHTTFYYVCEQCGRAADAKRAPDAKGEGGFPEGRRVEGYGDKYLVCRDGRVFRLTEDGNYETVAVHGDPPRTTLYRLGKRWRPRISTLIDRCYGEDQ